MHTRSSICLNLFHVFKAALLVGGASLLGAIGLVGIASLLGLKTFDEKFNKQIKKDDCCEGVENMLHKLRNNFEDEQEDQDRLESKQRDLCNLVSYQNSWRGKKAIC